MTEGIIVAIISGVVTLAGVILSNMAAGRKTQSQIEVAQAVTDTKIDELTREVRAHNNFAQRIPVLEEQNKVFNHRISDLEKIHKQN